MKHPDPGTWSDFVRGLASPGDRSALGAHLGSCDACRRTMVQLEHVAAVAQVDRRLVPPAHLVRWARALFSTPRPDTATAPLLGRLVYDSLAAPAADGLRSDARISRHVLFEAGTFALDLRLEYERGLSRVTLTGQLLDRQAPDRRFTDVAVQLARGRTEVASAPCNRFGEFQVTYEPTGRMRLYVVEGGRRRRVEVALNGLHDSAHG